MGRRGYDDRLKRKWQRKLDKQDEDKRWEAIEERERVLDMLADDDLGKRPSLDEALKQFYSGANMPSSVDTSPFFEWLKKHGKVSK